MFAHNLTVKKSYFSIELLWLKIERHLRLDLIVAPQWLTKLQNDRSIWLYGSRNRAKRDEIVIIKALKYNKIIRHSRQLWPARSSELPPNAAINFRGQQFKYIYHSRWHGVHSR